MNNSIINIASISEESEDEALLEELKNGNELAEELLVKKYSRQVRICARPYFLVGGDRDDLIQEGMLGLLTAIRKYEVGKSATFATFAEVCIKNRIISAVRGDNRLKHRHLNSSIPLEFSHIEREEEEGKLASTAHFWGNPENLVIDQETWQGLELLMKDKLSPLEHSILDWYLRGFSYADIAKAVKRPQKSVDNAIQRIRSKLAKAL